MHEVYEFRAKLAAYFIKKKHRIYLANDTKTKKKSIYPKYLVCLLEKYSVCTENYLVCLLTKKFLGKEIAFRIASTGI